MEYIFTLIVVVVIGGVYCLLIHFANKVSNSYLDAMDQSDDVKEDEEQPASLSLTDYNQWLWNDDITRYGGIL